MESRMHVCSHTLSSLISFFFASVIFFSCLSSRLSTSRTSCWIVVLSRYMATGKMKGAAVRKKYAAVVV